jgi:hypothetical protein
MLWAQITLFILFIIANFLHIVMGIIGTFLFIGNDGYDSKPKALKLIFQSIFYLILSAVSCFLMIKAGAYSHLF